MLERLQDAIERSRADYTDIRCERSAFTAVAWRGRELQGATIGSDTGGFVRCYSHGHGWGTASFSRLDDLARQVARAHENSLAARPASPLVLAPASVHQAHLRPALLDDPRDVPLDEKRRLVAHLGGELLRYDRRVVDAFVASRDEVTEHWFVASDGTAIFELRPDVTLAVAAVARDGGVIERAVDSVGAPGGWALLEEQDELVRATARRAVSLLEVRPVQGGFLPVIADPRLAGLIAHETIGHVAQADLQLEDPVAAALGRPGAKVGSSLLTIGDDGSAAGLRGTHPYDDEGTPTDNALLLQHGSIVGRLHTRETAAHFGEPPTGNARAPSWRHPPRARLTNTYVQNGSGTFADLVREVRSGVYACDAVACRRQGVHYAFTAAYGYRIRDGEVAELIKDVVIVGDLPDLLGAVDRVAGDFRWNEAAAGCTQGSAVPLPVTDGAPHIRFRSVEVRSGTS